VDYIEAGIILCLEKDALVLQHSQQPLISKHQKLGLRGILSWIEVFLSDVFVDNFYVRIFKVLPTFDLSELHRVSAL
jgi:hypothetical protein